MRWPDADLTTAHSRDVHERCVLDKGASMPIHNLHAHRDHSAQTS